MKKRKIIVIKREDFRMLAETLIGFVIFLFVAFIMIVIGMAQIKSKSPVGFYSGEKPPCEEELINVHEWNVKHGIMWISYGVVILLGYGIGCLMGDTVWCVVPMAGGTVAPIGVMVWYHHKLIKKYKK